MCWRGVFTELGALCLCCFLCFIGFILKEAVCVCVCVCHETRLGCAFGLRCAHLGLHCTRIDEFSFFLFSLRYTGLGVCFGVRCESLRLRATTIDGVSFFLLSFFLRRAPARTNRVCERSFLGCVHPNDEVFPSFLYATPARTNSVCDRSLYCTNPSASRVRSNSESSSWVRLVMLVTSANWRLISDTDIRVPRRSANNSLRAVFKPSRL
mmetsp:Transcript_50631/g.60907  ORF Transcript_50631/g.60907 Transcript_50631/m.60907 type:complete len:210 (+) Transcript_50631:45-674(+)